MPELPEVYYLSTWLNKKIKNKRLLKIVSNTKDDVDIKPAQIIDVSSKGKLIYIQTKHYYIHIHLMLTGWIQKEEPEFYKYKFVFSDETYYLADKRRFANIHVMDEQLHEMKLKELGKDFIRDDIDYKYFSFIRLFNKNISAVLLSQKDILSGIGNYIRNDSLYLSKINPNSKCNEIKEEHIYKLYESLKFIIFSKTQELFLSNGYKVPELVINKSPDVLQIPYNFKVYNKMFDRHNNKIVVETIAGRTAYYVPSIQIY